LVCELSCGQMVEDVRLVVGDRVPVYFHGRKGGMVPTPEEILDKVWGLPEFSVQPSLMMNMRG
jgi:2-oxoglutarate ferredoxin oxidoreductase subunit alpha